MTGAEGLRKALDDLQQAEAEYRLMHDLHGDGSQAAGRAWDLMRRAGRKARAALDAFVPPAAPDPEAIGRAILEADRAFGFRIQLIRLVDGVSTYELTYHAGGDPIEFDSYGDASDHVEQARNRARADAVIRTLHAPSGEDLDKRAEDLFNLIYAHTVVKYDPAAGIRCARAALGWPVLPVPKVEA